MLRTKRIAVLFLVSELLPSDYFFSDYPCVYHNSVVMEYLDETS